MSMIYSNTYLVCLRNLLRSLQNSEMDMEKKGYLLKLRSSLADSCGYGWRIGGM